MVSPETLKAANLLRGAEQAAPCRHMGAPSNATVGRAAAAIKSLELYPDILASYGLTDSEFRAALPAAIESVRGSMSANNSDRRDFLKGIFERMLEQGRITDIQFPVQGEDTVYRLDVPNLGPVAIIQKGCPDGAHGSVRWEVPLWAKETYLWWLCPSMKAHPGEHISKGVGRLKRRFFYESREQLSGVIFHNQLCGTSQRPCPKQIYSMKISGKDVPAPCVYAMPEAEPNASRLNWEGDRHLTFPSVLLGAFGIDQDQTSSFTGFVGFQRRGTEAITTRITTRFGPGRSSTSRS